MTFCLVSSNYDTAVDESKRPNLISQLTIAIHFHPTIVRFNPPYYIDIANSSRFSRRLG